MKNLLLAFAAIACIGLASCGSSDNCDTISRSIAITNISVSQTAYNNDPSTENCNEYKVALESFIDDNKDCDDIEAGVIVGYQMNLDSLACG